MKAIGIAQLGERLEPIADTSIIEQCEISGERRCWPEGRVVRLAHQAFPFWSREKAVERADQKIACRHPAEIEEEERYAVFASLIPGQQRFDEQAEARIGTFG